jgi:diacylglycerol kinase family enzyme
VLEIVGFTVSVVVAAAATRFAQGTDVKTLQRVRVSGEPAPVLRNPVLIMNPWSGGGKVERFGLVEESRRRGVEPVLLERGLDLRELALGAVKRGADVLGMAGGDGSQAIVAQVAMEHGLPYVCVPAGTRNHLALDLGLDRDDVPGALAAYTEGVPRTIDLATINDSVFVNNVSLGIYAEIVQSDEYRDAKLKTAADKLPQILGPDARPFDLEFDGPDGQTHPTAQLILVSNNPYRLTTLFGMGSRPRMDTGELGVVALELASAVDLERLVLADSLGRITRYSGWHEWSATTFEVRSHNPIKAGVDGEALVYDPPIRFAAIPGALQVRIPPQAPGLSPAAASAPASASLVHDLLRIAGGRTTPVPGAPTTSATRRS